MAKRRSIIQQSGAIPFRVADDGCVEMLLVTASSGKRWVFPKGCIESDLGPSETAKEEAWEEGGVRGRVLSPVIGSYRYEKRGALYEVTVHLLQVRKETERWPESDLRHRRWLPLRDALRLQGRPEARGILLKAARVLQALERREPALVRAYEGEGF